jgi:aldose 1-epimerase
MGKFSYSTTRHPHTGWQLIHLEYQGEEGAAASATLAPDCGSNLLRFAVDGHEYVREFRGAPGVDAAAVAGTPILYPSPNRMRDSQFSFDGADFSFPPNAGPHFIHGFVRHEAWQWEPPQVTDAGVSVRSSITVDPTLGWFNHFPIRNRLVFTHTLKPRGLRMEMEVYNEDADRRLPFGLAIHPFFCIEEPRQAISLQVPGQKWMETVEFFPTGELLDMEKGPGDLRQPTSLEGLDAHHVAWGMRADQPATITYHARNTRFVLHADDFFTHAVVYTPLDQPFFCIENQSCSTNAHNLYAQDNAAAHLTVLEPGESLRTWVEFEVQPLAGGV